MARYVPDDVTDQIKQGFSGPGRELVPRREHRLRPQRAARRRRARSTSSSTADGAAASSSEHLDGAREPAPAALVAAQLRALVPHVPAATGGRPSRRVRWRRRRGRRRADGPAGSPSLRLGRRRLRDARRADRRRACRAAPAASRGPARTVVRRPGRRVAARARGCAATTRLPCRPADGRRRHRGRRSVSEAADAGVCEVPLGASKLRHRRALARPGAAPRDAARVPRAAARAEGAAQGRRPAARLGGAPAQPRARPALQARAFDGAAGVRA